MAGALVMSGFHVPGPLKANESNPRGFHEPRWVVDRHKAVLLKARVKNMDSDPRAGQLVARRTDESMAAEVAAWLAAEFETHDRIVIKDPRTVWFEHIWRQAARDIGVEPTFVQTIRHPAEVTASHVHYYGSNPVRTLGGWINVSTLIPQLTEDAPRSFVTYDHLLDDWRTELSRVQRQLDLQLEPDPSEPDHPVDSFITTGLRRSAAHWRDHAFPPMLIDLAERVYEALNTIADEGDSQPHLGRLAQLREEYIDLYEAAHVLTGSRRWRHDNWLIDRGERRVEKAVARERRRAKAAIPPPPPRPLWRRAASRARARVRAMTSPR